VARPNSYAVDARGETVWKPTKDDLADQPINDACGAQCLPNGDTVLTRHHTTAKPIKLLAVTRDKKIVWPYTDDRRSGIHHVQILATNSNALKGRPKR
jgi:hypothetical protein